MATYWAWQVIHVPVLLHLVYLDYLYDYYVFYIIQHLLYLLTNYYTTCSNSLSLQQLIITLVKYLCQKASFAVVSTQWKHCFLQLYTFFSIFDTYNKLNYLTKNKWIKIWTFTWSRRRLSAWEMNNESQLQSGENVSTAMPLKTFFFFLSFIFIIKKVHIIRRWDRVVYQNKAHLLSLYSLF